MRTQEVRRCPFWPGGDFEGAVRSTTRPGPPSPDGPFGPFFGEGSATKKRLQKKGYSYSNLSTGPSHAGYPKNPLAFYEPGTRSPQPELLKRDVTRTYDFEAPN